MGGRAPRRCPALRDPHRAGQVVGTGQHEDLPAGVGDLLEQHLGPGRRWRQPGQLGPHGGVGGGQLLRGYEHARLAHGQAALPRIELLDPVADRPTGDQLRAALGEHRQRRGGGDTGRDQQPSAGPVTQSGRGERGDPAHRST
jgi:hypothetical protein